MGIAVGIAYLLAVRVWVWHVEHGYLPTFSWRYWSATLALVAFGVLACTVMLL